MRPMYGGLRFGGVMPRISESIVLDIENELVTSDYASFWGFYLGRPFRMNAGDITVPKPASSLTVGKEGTWRPYGLPANQEALSGELKNPNELISRQFAVLWEIISPLGHVLYDTT